MTAHILREPIDIIKFVGIEHEQILVSLANGSEEMKIIGHLQGLYRAPMSNATVGENEFVVFQLLTFTHYHFLYALACHMRCHLSEAFASARPCRCGFNCRRKSFMTVHRKLPMLNARSRSTS